MIKFSIAQTDAVLGDKEKNLQSLEKYCYKAKENDAQIICFPELATTGYSPALLGTQYFSLSETKNGMTDILFTKLSTELNIVIICGFVERDDTTNKIYNSAGVWIPNRKNWLGVYRKIHLYADEKFWFTPGEHLRIFDVGICRIGIMICFDLAFPEVARNLVAKDADILFMPSAWNERGKELWYIFTPCRALENNTHLVAVNRWGKEGEQNLFGGSRILNPTGEVVAEASEKSQDFISYNINLNYQIYLRNAYGYLADRKLKYATYS